MKKDPKHIATLDCSDFEGNLSDIIKRLQDILKRNPNAKVEYYLDWGPCYYESDTPYAKFEIKSK